MPGSVSEPSASKGAILKSVVFIFLLIFSMTTSAEGVDKEKIRVEIRKHIKSIRECYETESNKTKDLHGRVVLGWFVDDKAKVKKVEIVERQTTLKNTAVQNCLKDVVRSMQFDPAPKDQEYSVSYPFVFSNK